MRWSERVTTSALVEVGVEGAAAKQGADRIVDQRSPALNGILGPSSAPWLQVTALYLVEAHDSG